MKWFLSLLFIISTPCLGMNTNNDDNECVAILLESFENNNSLCSSEERYCHFFDTLCRWMDCCGICQLLCCCCKAFDENCIQHDCFDELDNEISNDPENL